MTPVMTVDMEIMQLLPGNYAFRDEVTWGLGVENHSVIFRVLFRWWQCVAAEFSVPIVILVSRSVCG